MSIHQRGDHQTKCELISPGQNFVNFVHPIGRAFFGLLKRGGHNIPASLAGDAERNNAETALIFPDADFINIGLPGGRIVRVGQQLCACQDRGFAGYETQKIPIQFDNVNSFSISFRILDKKEVVYVCCRQTEPRLQQRNCQDALGGQPIKVPKLDWLVIFNM